MHRSHVITRATWILALGLLGTATAGYGAFSVTSQSAPPASRLSSGALVPVQLPDLSRSPAAVRRQIEATYDRLQPITSAPGASLADRSEAMGQMGRLLMEADYYDAAEHCFQHAMRLQPDDARWTYLLGHVYRLRREPGRAAVAFEATLRLRAEDAATLVWLGNTYLELGQLDRAEALFERALARP